MRVGRTKSIVTARATYGRGHALRLASVIARIGGIFGLGFMLGGPAMARGDANAVQRPRQAQNLTLNYDPYPEKTSPITEQIPWEVASPKEARRKWGPRGFPTIAPYIHPETWPPENIPWQSVPGGDDDQPRMKPNGFPKNPWDTKLSPEQIKALVSALEG